MPANAFAQILRATPEIKLFTQRRSRWCTTGCLHINRLTARHGGSQHTLVQFSFVCSTSKVAIKPLAPFRRPSALGQKARVSANRRRRRLSKTHNNGRRHCARCGYGVQTDSGQRRARYHHGRCVRVVAIGLCARVWVYVLSCIYANDNHMDMDGDDHRGAVGWK